MCCRGVFGGDGAVLRPIFRLDNAAKVEELDNVLCRS